MYKRSLSRGEIAAIAVNLGVVLAAALFAAVRGARPPETLSLWSTPAYLCIAGLCVPSFLALAGLWLRVRDWRWVVLAMTAIAIPFSAFYSFPHGTGVAACLLAIGVCDALLLFPRNRNYSWQEKAAIGLNVAVLVALALVMCWGLTLPPGVRESTLMGVQLWLMAVGPPCFLVALGLLIRVPEYRWLVFAVNVTVVPIVAIMWFPYSIGAAGCLFVLAVCDGLLLFPRVLSLEPGL